MQKAEFY